MRGWTAALLAVLPGCYLSHVLEGPDDGPLPPPAPPSCPAAPHAPGVFVPAFEGAESNDAAELAVGGCEHVHAIDARAPFSWLTSRDHGASFRAVDLALEALPDLAVATDADGAAHVVVARSGAIVHRTVSPEDVVGPESALGGQGAATLLSGPWPRPHHVAAVRADGALAAVWSEPRFEALHLGWRGRDGEIEPPARVATAGAGERVQEARLFFAGDRLVIAWEQLTDCRTAEVFGAVLDGPGEVLPQRLGTSLATCSTSGGLDVGCSADGRALVVWAESEGEYLRGRGAMGVAVLEDGRLEPRAPILAPRWWGPAYPTVHAGASRALVTFGGPRIHRRVRRRGLRWEPLRGPRDPAERGRRRAHRRHDGWLRPPGAGRLLLRGLRAASALLAGARRHRRGPARPRGHARRARAPPRVAVGDRPERDERRVHRRRHAARRRHRDGGVEPAVSRPRGLYGAGRCCQPARCVDRDGTVAWSTEPRTRAHRMARPLLDAMPHAARAGGPIAAATDESCVLLRSALRWPRRLRACAGRQRSGGRAAASRERRARRRDRARHRR
ncbi:MAG: hypothetical protein M5U28_45015 [Sandaracinaceae bacterium]|nr:hypothetical protein [Sandaracinaceae bacterium]